MVELKETVERKKPLIIVICEATPKNPSDTTPVDYEITNFTLYPINLNNNIGRGIALYAHNSQKKSAIQVIPSQGFHEVCLIEVQLPGGDTFLTMKKRGASS